MGGDVIGDGEDDIKILFKVLLVKLEGMVIGDNVDIFDDKDKKDLIGDGEDNEEEIMIIGDFVYCVEVIILGIDLSCKVKLIVFKCDVLVVVDKILVCQVVGDVDICKLFK